MLKDWKNIKLKLKVVFLFTQYKNFNGLSCHLREHRTKNKRNQFKLAKKKEKEKVVNAQKVGDGYTKLSNVKNWHEKSHQERATQCRTSLAEGGSERFQKLWEEN